jgi:hypothetical protein
LIAYTLRKSYNYFDAKTKVALAREVDKLLGRGFSNSEIQSKNGKKGGKIGGSKNSNIQKQARSQVGKAYGRSTGLSNQSDSLKDACKLFHLWKHKKNSAISIVTYPTESGVEIAKQLHQKCKELGFDEYNIDFEKVKKGGPFYKVLKNPKKRTYKNWYIDSSFSSLEINLDS